MTADRTERPLENIVMLPCPFCGAEPCMIEAGAELTEDMFCRVNPTEVHKKKFAWACDDNENCGVSGPFRDTMREAVEAWNTRQHNA